MFHFDQYCLSKKRASEEKGRLESEQLAKRQDLRKILYLDHSLPYRNSMFWSELGVPLSKVVENVFPRGLVNLAKGNSNRKGKGKKLTRTEAETPRYS